MNTRARLLACTFLLMPSLTPLLSNAQQESGFLTDYSKLKPAKDNPLDEFYLAPEALQRASRYTSVMVDQPELFIHPDSKYKGIKPDEMKVIADALREHVTAELKDGYQVVNEPGAGVLYLRLAVTDLMLQKKKRPVLAYIPVGAVVYAAKNIGKEVTSKLDLTNMKLEVEILDSASMEQLAALTSRRGSAGGPAPAGEVAKPLSWEELGNLFTVVGKRLRCRLDNARVSEAKWQECGTIGLSTLSAPQPPR